MKKFLVLLLSLALILSSTCMTFAANDVEELSLKSPTGIYVEPNGDILVTDVFSNNIVKMTGDALSLIAGKTLISDLYGFPLDQYRDGAATEALFAEPYAIVPYMEGYVVSDPANNVLRYIAGGRVKTLSGSGKADFKNGTGDVVAFNRPTGLATDGEGNLYIADTLNNAIRKMEPNGKVSTYVTGLLEPTGLCFANGILYVADSGNQRICSVEDGILRNVAGNKDYRYAGEIDASIVAGGFVDGPVAKALFSNPVSVAVDTANNTIYVGDMNNNAIRKIENGKVSTVAKADALALEMFPSEPKGLAFTNGKLYVADAMSGVKVIDADKLRIPVSNFADVNDSAWYKGAVDYVYAQGLFSGTSATTFSPQTPMSRGMFVTVLSRLHTAMNQSEIISGETIFTDIDSSKYYSSPASWAADYKIVNGTGNGNFSPDQNITREQMAVMLYNYIKFANEDMNITSASEKQYNEMPDKAAVSDYAVTPLKWAMSKGIINGKDGRLAPKDTATRAEVAQMLLNFSKLQ